ncbi:MAG: FKBP-type peptidyl-prolyl cis-trans isomerase [Bacteroidales bacterium]|nr:FKBP-type peptidyl-prolyl cis-trans isomerase [Bacteroidales bacterium]MDT8432173.1 FKBP-type peptidyl-prolyl cis-trans isomerase [Bacteroidales bacterium]
MEITKDKVVSITYELRRDAENGEVVETVTTVNPLTFIYGTGGMLPKFEENLDGLKAGDTFKFGLNSEDAYGPVVENAIVEVPLDVFKVDGEVDNNILQVGNMVPMMDNSGNRLNGKILSIGEDAVKMDFNHPMAGKDLFFTGTVTEIREATEEDLSHGHLHGSGGGCASGNCGDGGCSC